MATIWEASSKLTFLFIKAINHILYSFVHLVLCLRSCPEEYRTFIRPYHLHLLYFTWSLIVHKGDSGIKAG